MVQLGRIAVLVLFIKLSIVITASAVADRFIFPILADDHAVATNNEDPRKCGWYVWNDFGSYYPDNPISSEHPWHPAEDWNRADGRDDNGNEPVYSIGDGIVARIVRGDTGYGDALLVRYKLLEMVDFSPYFLSETTPRTKYKSGQYIIVQYMHIVIDSDLSKGDPVYLGQRLGVISSQFKHLHFEIMVDPDGTSYPSVARNLVGYYATRQSITDYGYINPTKFILDNVVNDNATSYTYSNDSYTGSGPVQGGSETNWQFSLSKHSNTFTAGDHVYGMVCLRDVTVKHRFRVKLYRNGEYQYEYPWGWNDVGSGWSTAYFWPELPNATVGAWEFRVYLDYEKDGQSFSDHIDTLAFTVEQSDDWQPYVYDDNAYAGYGPVTGGADTDWMYSLEQHSDTFTAGETSYVLLRIDDVKRDHRFRFIAYHDGAKINGKAGYTSGWNRVGSWGWQHAYTWAQLNNVTPGTWSVQFFVDAGNGFEGVDTVFFTVEQPNSWQPYAYNGNGYTGYGPPEGGQDSNWEYWLPEKRTTFTEGDAVYAMMHVDDIRRDFRLRTVTYCNGVQQYDYQPAEWNDVGSGWNHAYHWPQWGNVWPGEWRFDIYIDIGEGWEFLKTIPFTVVPAVGGQPPQPPPPDPNPQPVAPLVMDLSGYDSQGWTTGYDTWVPQNQPDPHYWQVVAEGPNPGIVSPELPNGYSTARTPMLRLSAKIRGPVRDTFAEIYVKGDNGSWNNGPVTVPVRVDYRDHEYAIDLSSLGDIPIRRFSIELTQNASYEEWWIDWIELLGPQ